MSSTANNNTANSDALSNINALYKLEEEKLRPLFIELKDARRKGENLLIDVKNKRDLLERALREERERQERQEQQAEEQDTLVAEDDSATFVAEEIENEKVLVQEATVETHDETQNDVVIKTTEATEKSEHVLDKEVAKTDVEANIEKAAVKPEKVIAKTEKVAAKIEKEPLKPEKTHEKVKETVGSEPHAEKVADKPKINPLRAQNVAEPRKFVPIKTYIPENNDRQQRRDTRFAENRPGGFERKDGAFPNRAPGGFGAKPSAPPAGATFIPPAASNSFKGKPSKKSFDKGNFEDKKTNKRVILRRELANGEEIDASEIARRFKSKKYLKPSLAPQPIVIDRAVININPVSIKVLGDKIGKPSADIVKKLLILGIFKNINDSIDFDTASLISGEFGVELELKLEQTMEDKLDELVKEEAIDTSKLVKRAPIVTIMGHVDHGKTSLLDYIRKANVASGEAGGITQHIGAYTIKLKGEKITFLDTPGHEAFTALRARGAQVTDIAVIVVAADDSIMPQTLEAINHARAANVPIIIAANKMDKSAADIEKVKVDLSNNGLLVEDWGGDIICIPVSAKTGEGVDKLLENMLLVAELNELKANPKANAKGTIIEARLDKAKGPIATILVQNGTLKVSDYVVAGSVTGRVKLMFDDKGNPVKSAGPSMPVSILGFEEVPHAGDQIVAVDEKLAKQLASERRIRQRDDKFSSASTNLEDIFKQIGQGKLKDLNLIIKADVQGSVEALVQELNKLTNSEVKVTLVHSAVGAVNESDVMLASTSNSIIICFNVRPDTNAKIAAARFSIDIRNYRIIYDVINDIELALKGMLAPKFKETLLGKAEVRDTFRITGVGTIAGCYVVEGKIERNASIRLLRDNIVITEGKISSLKRIKDDVKEVATGYECGVGINNYNDIKNGDIIECFTIEKVE
ncbi:MAG: translation initiation factor IF-2 [Clostridia bacterium]|nr:translation initiation factor IF-2 [Clostridia bacterium]